MRVVLEGAKDPFGVLTSARFPAPATRSCCPLMAPTRLPPLTAARLAIDSSCRPACGFGLTA
jgi:hypothetical protein